MTAVIPAFRTFVLAFLLLAGSLAAAVAVPARDAGAAGPCNVASRVLYAQSQGSYYVQGFGASNCSYAGTQSISVYLYLNGNRIAVRSGSGYGTSISARTATSWATCGNYRVATTHHFAQYSTTTWSTVIRFC